MDPVSGKMSNSARTPSWWVTGERVRAREGRSDESPGSSPPGQRGQHEPSLRTQTGPVQASNASVRGGARFGGETGDNVSQTIKKLTIRCRHVNLISSLVISH